MTKKNATTGSILSKNQMKNLRGGIAWPGLRDFSCVLNNGTVMTGGCDDTSGNAIKCCKSKYGSAYSTGLNWGAYGCPYRAC